MAELTRRSLLTAGAAVGTATAVTATASSPPAPEPGPPRAVRPCEWTATEIGERDHVISVGFTPEEADCWLLVARAAEAFFALPALHPSDGPETAQAIHVVQQKLLSRPVYRRYRDGWPRPGG